MLPLHDHLETFDKIQTSIFVQQTCILLVMLYSFRQICSVSIVAVGQGSAGGGAVRMRSRSSPAQM